MSRFSAAQPLRPALKQPFRVQNAAEPATQEGKVGWVGVSTSSFRRAGAHDERGVDHIGRTAAPAQHVRLFGAELGTVTSTSRRLSNAPRTTDLHGPPLSMPPHQGSTRPLSPRLVRLLFGDLTAGEALPSAATDGRWRAGIGQSCWNHYR